MVRKLQGVWYQNRVLCPQCLVRPAEIRDYGTDEQGYWFKAICPHCRAVIQWTRPFDFSRKMFSQTEGEQLTLIIEKISGNNKSGTSVLAYPKK